MTKQNKVNEQPSSLSWEKYEFESPINTGAQYTYSDYLTWDDDKRREIIYGSIYMMAAPTINHQALLMNLSWQLENYLHNKPCKVFPAPIDVRLMADPNVKEADDKKNDKMVVQPDISVICDRKKLHAAACWGAPDFVIEIISPSSASKDCIAKFNAYQDAGVKEYWIVDPMSKTLNVFTLLDGRYVSQKHYNCEKVKIGVLSDCNEDCLIDMGLAYSKMIAVE